MESKNGLNLLVCGSQQFQDDIFVYETLTNFFEMTRGNIRAIHTSKFSGACEFAKIWVEQTNAIRQTKIIVKDDVMFDMHLLKNNLDFYDKFDIPLDLAKDNPFFKKGKELLMSKDINLIMAFPNQTGHLGSSTKNILKFAELAKVKVFDCSELLKKINESRFQKQEKEVPQYHSQSDDLKNRLKYVS